MAVDQLVPAFVAEPHGVCAGLRHVGAEDGRQHGFGSRGGPDAREEFLHLSDHRVGVTEIRPVIVGLQFKQPGVRDVLGEVAAGLDRRDLIATCVDNQRRDLDGGQDVADVDQVVHPQEVRSVARAGAELRKQAPPASYLRVRELARGVVLHSRAGAPGVPNRGHLLLELVFGDSPRVVGSPQSGRVAAVDDQPRGPLGICGGEKGRHHAALRDAKQRRPLRAHRIQHRANVVHTLLKARRRVHAVRHSAASLVEQDEPRKRGEAVQKRSHRRQLPDVGQVRDPAQHEHEIYGAVAHDLIGDVDVATASVIRRCKHF